MVHVFLNRYLREFVIFEGYQNRNSPVVNAGDAVHFSGFCKGAVKNAGGHGSIIGFEIGGLIGGTTLNFDAESDASGIVIPLALVNASVPTWKRSPKLDIAYIIANTTNNRLRIVTTNNPFDASPDGIIGTDNVNDGLSLKFDSRSVPGETFTYDDGTLPFEDFIFYGNYKV